MLRVRDVDLPAGTMTVRDPKTPASRRAVPIHPDLVSIIKRARCGAGQGGFRHG